MRERGDTQNRMDLKMLPASYWEKVAWAMETPCDYEYWCVCW